MSRRLFAALAVVLVACDGPSVIDPPSTPQSEQLDLELRQAIAGWGPLPIGPVPAQSPALVELGRSLFFDKILSGNRDVSCATCHDPDATLTDKLALAVGTGGTGTTQNRVLGAGRSFVPRNAPSLLNQGLGTFYTLWDGRVNEEGGPGNFRPPSGIVFPAGLANLLAAQAMLPVLNRDEMRGVSGDVDVMGNPNELAVFTDNQAGAVWQGVMSRLLAIQDYAAKFAVAFPNTPRAQLGFQHAANALAAFQIASFTKTNSPFDRFLKRDNTAMTAEEKRGGLVFFGSGQCASCHSGSLLGGNQFANIGIAQFGPGVGASAPLDVGRGEQFPGPPGVPSFYQFFFRVPMLRNVELTAPYMHNGAYTSLEQVVRHYTNADSALRNYPVAQLDPALQSMYRGDATTITKILATLDGRLRSGFGGPFIRLTAAEQSDLVAFLKALTDPAARDLSALVPASVPSGLPVRD
jgi:cytochrome c peroxidase